MLASGQIDTDMSDKSSRTGLKDLRRGVRHIAPVRARSNLHGIAS